MQIGSGDEIKENSTEGLRDLPSKSALTWSKRSASITFGSPSNFFTRLVMKALNINQGPFESVVIGKEDCRKKC